MANVLEQLALSTLLILQELGKRNKLVKSEELYKQDTFLSTSIHLHPKCASNFPSWKAVKSGCLTLKSHNSIGSLLSEVSIEVWQHAHLPCFLSASCVPLPTLVGHLERGSMQHHSHCAQGCKIQEVWYGTKIEKTSNTQSGYPAVHSVETGTRTKKQRDVPVHILQKQPCILQHSFDSSMPTNPHSSQWPLHISKVFLPQHEPSDHSCEYVLIFHLPTKKLHNICWCSTWQLSCAAVNCCRSTCSSAWSSSALWQLGVFWHILGAAGLMRWMETPWSWCPKQSFITHSLMTPTSGSKIVKASRSVWCDDVCHDATWCNNNKKKKPASMPNQPTRLPSV